MPSDLLNELILIIQIWLLLNWLQIWQEYQAHEQKKAKQKPKRETIPKGVCQRYAEK